MRILHLMSPSSRMMKTFVDSVQRAYPNDEHFFYTTRHVPKSEEDFFSQDNMLNMSGVNRREKIQHFKSHCRSADVIVWHGFLYPFRMMLYIFANRWILDKSIWVMWGIDLYNWKDSSRTPKSLFVNFVNAHCRKRVRAVIALLDPDKDYYSKMFPHGAPCFVAPYPISVESFLMMEERKTSGRRLNKVVNVQIGNNAHSFNNHNRVLDAIDRLDADSTNYYFPVSYGGSEDWKGNKADYITSLISRAKDAYGERAHFLRKMMLQEEYTNYLWNIDIAIFDADRQNALGNMLKLLYMGSKVYLSPDNPLYSFFQSKDVVVYNARSLSDISVEEFYAKGDSSNAVEWIRDTYYPSNAIKRWGPVFDLFRNDGVVEAEDIEDVAFAAPTKRFVRKPNYISISPYSSAKKRLPTKWHYAVLAGGGSTLLSVAQSVMESEPRWFLTGVIDERGTSNDINVSHIALGTYCSSDEIDILPSRVKPVLAFSSGDDRAKWVEKYGILQKDNQEVDDLDEDPGESFTFISSRANLGFGVEVGSYCTITSHSQIMPGCSLGDGVLVDAARIGCECSIGDYATIKQGAICGDKCVIGKYATIESGAVLDSGTVIPDFGKVSCARR